MGFECTLSAPLSPGPRLSICRMVWLVKPKDQLVLLTYKGIVMDRITSDVTASFTTNGTAATVGQSWGIAHSKVIFIPGNQRSYPPITNLSSTWRYHSGLDSTVLQFLSLTRFPSGSQNDSQHLTEPTAWDFNITYFIIHCSNGSRQASHNAQLSNVAVLGQEPWQLIISRYPVLPATCQTTFQWMTASHSPGSCPPRSTLHMRDCNRLLFSFSSEV